MSNNMVLVCEQSVDSMGIAGGTTLGFHTHQPAGPKGLFTTTNLCQSLSKFCTQLLHSRLVLFTSVNKYLSAFSTTPTITITTYI